VPTWTAAWNASLLRLATQVFALGDSLVTTRIEALVPACSPASPLRRIRWWRGSTIPQDGTLWRSGRICGTTFGQVASTGFGSSLHARPRGQEKGSVETWSGSSRTASSKYGASTTAADLESSREWHIEVNEVRACRRPGVTPPTHGRNRRLRPLASRPRTTRCASVMWAPRV